ncbi:hypothetical protein C2845_PM01G39390 [Panicum miliaceum]|uniref:F-box associated beta-propeller type 3 domain-containing protein n=1 Tax=Panicum miliaceum TaxID=4540 RepID=A0A3L6TJF5_PANMI|nr:hypothetical protein C2845_PM01G39390 [Panicum miliaceum]
MFMNNSLFRGEFVTLETLAGMSCPPPLTGDRSIAFCSNPCHGLNLVTCGGRHYVCNSITGSYQCILSSTANGIVVGAGHIGLGYDPVAEKHMLVRLAYGENHSECKVRYVGDYSWHAVDSPPPRQVDSAAAPVFANGRLYWMADSKTEPRSPRCEIMAFDVLTASFEVLQGPPCGDLVDDGGERAVSVLERRGELRVARSNRDANWIEVWAMKDRAMWSLYHIELERFSPEYMSPETTALAVDPEDGRILLSTGRVLGYNDASTAAVETIHRLGSVPFGDGIGSGYKFTPALCHESLVCPFD